MPEQQTQLYIYNTVIYNNPTLVVPKRQDNPEP